LAPPSNCLWTSISNSVISWRGPRRRLLCSEGYMIESTQMRSSKCNRAIRHGKATIGRIAPKHSEYGIYHSASRVIRARNCQCRQSYHIGAGRAWPRGGFLGMTPPCRRFRQGGKSEARNSGTPGAILPHIGQASYVPNCSLQWVSVLGVGARGRGHTRAGSRAGHRLPSRGLPFLGGEKRVRRVGS
jgi:hypothetical protein